MATRNTACYYGRHIGCLNATNNSDCRLCAERLTNAVNRVLHPTAANANCGNASPYGGAVREHASQLAEAITTRVKEHSQSGGPLKG